jgi:hypothetical protein
MFGDLLQRKNVNRLVQKNFEILLNCLNNEIDNSKELFDKRLVIGYRHKISSAVSSIFFLKSIKKRITKFMAYFGKIIKM